MIIKIVTVKQMGNRADVSLLLWSRGGLVIGAGSSYGHGSVPSPRVGESDTGQTSG